MADRQPIVMTADATERGLPFPDLIEALRHAFRRNEIVPPRHHHDLQLPDGEGTLLLMPAWSSKSGYLGVKIATVYPGNSAKRLPGVHATYLLADVATGRPLAYLDGDQITTRRTAAVAALAADYLARPDATSLLVVGSGRVAMQLPEAFSAVRPIQDIVIWDRTFEKADALAQKLLTRGLPVRATASLSDAAGHADIISCATLATSPLIRGAWLRPGTHLDLIGGFSPAMREADDKAMARARIYVDVPEAVGTAGDLVQPIRSGAISRTDVIGTLSDLCNGEGGRRASDEITVFKAVGTALADIAAAGLCYEQEYGDPCS